MPIEVTNALTPEMQAVADCREAVKNCEADVEVRKLALKEAKAAWETAVGALNEAIDTAIDAERQPTLFNRFGKDKLDDPPTEAATTAGTAGEAGSVGDVTDAEFTVNPPEVASLPAPAVDGGEPAIEAGAGEGGKGKRGKHAKKGAA